MTLRHRATATLGFGALLLGLVAGAVAQPSDVTGFAFLRTEPSARAAALAGSVGSSYGDDVNGLFYNPALLNESMHGMLSLSYLNHLTDINGGFIAYARHYEGIGTIGAGLRFVDWGSLERANEAGERLGNFNAGDVALSVSAARPYGERLRYGATAHVVYSAIESFRASALAVDLGGMYYVADADFAVSASVNNLGFVLSSLGAASDELPIDLRLGVSKKLAHLPLLISVMGYNLHDFDTVSDEATVIDNVLYHVAVGGELQFSESFNVRVGYNHRRHDTLRSGSRLDFAGVGLGAGIRVKGFRFDYAYNSWSTLGGLNQLTLGTRI